MGHYDDIIDGDTPTIDDTLKERGHRYGEFSTQAQLSQGLKNAVMQHYYNTHGQEKSTPLPPFVAEAIGLICHKLSRIANGDPLYIDSWRDLSAYSELVTKELATTEGASDSTVSTTFFKDGAWT